MFKRLMFAVCLFFVICCLIFVSNGCGQSGSSATTTTTAGGSTTSTSTTPTTSTTTSAINRSNGLSISYNNGCRTYGGARATGISGVGVFGTYTVTGYVYHALTGLPVSDVTITTGTSVATSDASGYYSLSNVSGGTVVFTAIPPDISDGYVCYAAVATDAQNIDFYVCYFGSYYSMPSAGSVQITSEPSTWMYCVSSVTGEIWSSYAGTMSGPKDDGIWDVGDLAVGPLYASAGNAALGNGFTATYLSQDSTTHVVTVEIPSEQGTVGGSIVVPAAYQDWTVSTMSPAWFAVDDNKYAYSAYWLNNNNVYSVPVPAGQQFLLCSSFVSTEGYSVTIAAYGLSVEASETISQDIEFKYDMVSNIQITSQESGNTTYTTITWEAPSLFTPDMYMIMGSGLSAFSFIYTTDTTITVPFVVRDSEYTMIFAIDCQDSVDLDSFSIFNTYFNGYSYHKAGAGGG